MAKANFGVNVTINAEAARPISIQSITPIGIAGTAEGVENGLYYYGSVTAAKDALKNVQGSLQRAVSAIYDQAVETPIMLSVFEDSAGNGTTACKNAIELFANSMSEFGYRPNLLIAPEYSDIDVIASSLQTQAQKLKATAIVDLSANSETEAVTKANNFGSKRILLCDPYIKTWDNDIGDYVFTPQSARVAGLIAKTDGESEYGWSDSYSNRVINGIYGTKRAIEFTLGEDCEADRLRTAHISTIIRAEGWRAWGGETTEQDTIWQDLARVRIFDRISEACQKGVFYAVDKKADQLYYARQSVEELLRNLVGSKVLLGYEVSWSLTKNTQATVTAGKFYLDVRMQNNPIVKVLELDFIYTDTWSDQLIASLNRS